MFNAAQARRKIAAIDKRIDAPARRWFARLLWTFGGALLFVVVYLLAAVLGPALGG